MPFMNPNSSNSLSHQSTPSVDFESQVRDHSILQHHYNQHMPPTNFPDESEINFALEQYEDLQLFYQTACNTQAGNPGFATEAVLIPTHYGLSQEVEQPLTNPSHSAPEAETLIGDCPSALFTDLVKDAIPQGFYADCTESQAGAVTSLDPGHPSPSQSATFPTSQCQNSFQRGSRVRASDDSLPEQCSSQVSVRVSPAQGDDPVLLLDAEIDSNSQQATIPRVPTLEFSESLKSLPVTGDALAKLREKASQRQMHKAKAAKKGSNKVLLCDTCGKEFGCSQNYNRHLHTHTRMRPFKCQRCGKSFRRRDTFKRHVGTCNGKATASVTNSDYGRGNIDGRTNDAPQLRTSTIPRKTGTNPNCHTSGQEVLKIEERGLNGLDTSLVGRPPLKPLGMSSPSHSSGAPQLVRTSTIAANAGYNPNYPPTSLYSDKAALKISGKLESMAENWTSEERANRRRIVLFRKTQKGSIVYATYEPVSVNERPINSICISCILWAEKGECYVTSVDTIHLLEQLVAAPNRFSVEEKDRIRRDLEGFHPITVSKTKPDSEEFFRIIMGFPKPKPRNIEKDIKVFPWKILGGALKKVFGKYSISPSDTVSALNVDPGQRMLLPPRTSTTSQQACPVTEELEQPLTDPSNLAPEAEMLMEDYPSAFHAELVNENILPEGSWYDYPESQPAQSHKVPYADMKQQKEGIQSDYVSVRELLAQRDIPINPINPALLLDAEIDSNSKQAAIPRVSTEGVFDYPQCTRTSGDVRDYGHGKIDGRTNDAPQLRTSTIPRKTGTNSNCHASDQAVLKIAGNLESMAENWTSEELTNRRRIVVFHRTQKGSTLNTTLEPLNINSKFDGRACVSCIWWAEEGEFYITSADIILLAEYLVDAKESFTSKEATMIRSKLDMFYPITVSAKDSGSQGFYKIVVGFSHPEPLFLRKESFKVYLWNELESALKSALEVIIIKRYGFGLGSTRETPRPPRYLMSRPQTLNSTSFTGLPSSVDQAPPAEDAHETLQQDCVPRAEAAAPSSANANRIYSDTGERPLKYQGMDCNSISQPQTYLTHVQGTQNSPSTPELELPVLSTSNIIWEVHSEIPHQARPDPDSKLTSPKSESSLPETFIHDESDSDSAENTIVVGARPGQDKQNAPTLPVDKHIDGVDDTYKDNEEKARGSKPSVTYDDDDWGYAIADGKITIHCKNTLLTNFDREVPVRGMCPGVQRILDRIHELFLKGDIKEQQEAEAESEQIHIKGRTRPMTQRNISFSENTEQQQSSEVTYATIDELQKMLPESKGLDLSRISKSELDVILKAVQEVLNTIQQVLITSWIEEAEPAKQLLDEFQCYCTYE